MSIANSKQMSF